MLKAQELGITPEEMVAKKHPSFVPLEDREEGYVVNKEADELVQEYIEDLEEEDAVSVSESMIIDKEYAFGIGVEVALHVDEVSDTVIREFIEKFNNGTFQLDNTEKSFKHFDEEE